MKWSDFYEAVRQAGVMPTDEIESIDIDRRNNLRIVRTVFNSFGTNNSYNNGSFTAETYNQDGVQ